MKDFHTPVFEVIDIDNNDVIATSTCPPNTCYGNDCPECPWCSGPGSCDVHDCGPY